MKLGRTENKTLLSAFSLIVIIFMSTIGSHVYAQPEGSGNVHGTVVDENGEVLYKVKVMAYSSSGSLTDTEYTDDDGFFRFALEKGSYTISFEKEGYVKVEKSISVPTGFYNESENDPVKMGEIELTRSLALSSLVLSRVASPEDTIYFPFTLSNAGDEAEDIQFSLIIPGWDARILDSTGEIKRVYLDTGSLNLDLRVTVPSTFSEMAIIELTAIGTKNATLCFTIYPKTSITREIELISTYLTVSQELGRKVQIPMSVTNKGEIDETFDLVGIVPSGWSISFVTDTQMAVQSLYLTAGQSETLTIEIEPHDDAVIGDYHVVVNAVSEGDVLRDSLELEVNLDEAESDVEIISTFTEVTVEAGKAINFPIAIWNKGDNDALFLLTVLSAPENWKTVFTSEDIEVSSFLITAGDSLTLQLEVTPPSVVETGGYPIIIYAESDDGLISKQIDLKASVVGSYELDIDLSTLYDTVTIGDSVKFTVKVTNKGESPVTSLYIEAEVPEEWDVSVTPVQIAKLAPRDSTTFNIMAETPADTVAGDYLMTFTAISDQEESDETQIRLTAKASTSWGLIGVGIAGVTIIGLVIVFMRFKRR